MQNQLREIQPPSPPAPPLPTPDIVLVDNSLSNAKNEVILKELETKWEKKLQDLVDNITQLQGMTSSSASTLSTYDETISK